MTSAACVVANKTCPDFDRLNDMLDRPGPIVVSFNRQDKDHCYVTEPKKTILMPPNCQKKLKATISSALKQCAKIPTSASSQDQAAEKCPAQLRTLQPAPKTPLVPGRCQYTICLPHTRQGSNVHQAPAVARKPAGDKNSTASIAADTGDNRSFPAAHPQSGSATSNKQSVVKFLARPESKAKDATANVTTLTTSEFAQLLKTCNVTVKSSSLSKKRGKTRGGAFVVRPPASWSRTKSLAPPLKWHHTNFDPDKNRKEKKATKVASANPAVTNSAPSSKPKPKPASPIPQQGNTRTLSKQALPLPLALRDLATRDRAAAETLKETEKPATITQSRDPFLGVSGDDSDAVVDGLLQCVTKQCATNDSLQQCLPEDVPPLESEIEARTNSGYLTSHDSSTSCHADLPDTPIDSLCDVIASSDLWMEDSTIEAIDKTDTASSKEVKTIETPTDKESESMASYLNGSMCVATTNAKIAPPAASDVDATTIFEGLFEGDNAKLLDDDTVNHVLMDVNLPLFDMIGEMDLRSGGAFTHNRRSESQVAARMVEDFYGSCYASSDVKPPPPQLYRVESNLARATDSMTSSTFDHVTGKFQTASLSFSDTDSGIHSPGSTPVKNSPMSNAFDIDGDVTNSALREWRSCGYHSDAATTSCSSTSPLAEQECTTGPSNPTLLPVSSQFFFGSTSGNSNYYLATSYLQERVSSPVVASNRLSPDPEHHLLNMDDRSFCTAQPLETFLTGGTPTLTVQSPTVDDNPSEYFVNPTYTDVKSGEATAADAIVSTHVKYNRMVGSWQVALTLDEEERGERQETLVVDAVTNFVPCSAANKTAQRRRRARTEQGECSAAGGRCKRKSVGCTGDEDGQRSLCCKLRKMSTDRGKTVHLWEFIRDILLDPEHCPDLIRWEDRDQGVFRFVQSDMVASMWGEKKRNPKMTYEKLSRAMRYYYNRGILERVDGRRLVYKFGPNAHGWKASSTGPGTGVASPGKDAETGAEQQGVPTSCAASPINSLDHSVSGQISAVIISTGEGSSADNTAPQSPQTLVTSSDPIYSVAQFSPLLQQSRDTSMPPSWLVPSDVTSSLPSANVLLGKQIRLASVH